MSSVARVLNARDSLLVSSIFPTSCDNCGPALLPWQRCGGITLDLILPLLILIGRNIVFALASVSWKSPAIKCQPIRRRATPHRAVKPHQKPLFYNTTQRDDNVDSTTWDDSDISSSSSSRQVQSFYGDRHNNWNRNRCHYYFVAGSGAKHCNEYVCLKHRHSRHNALHCSQQQSNNGSNFFSSFPVNRHKSTVCLSAHITRKPYVGTLQNLCVCCLRPWLSRCDISCTSGFVDDVMFLHNKPYGTLCVFLSGNRTHEATKAKVSTKFWSTIRTSKYSSCDGRSLLSKIALLLLDR